MRENFGTGDINLAAACMAMGIPLKPFRPVQVIKRDNGEDYGRFNLEMASVCGRFDAMRLSAVFGGQPARPGEENFCAVLEFVRARPAGVHCLDDWYGHAVAWLRGRGETVLPQREQVMDFIRGAPESEAAHVFAFILNREHAYQLARRACERPQLMMSRGAGHVLVDEHMPRQLKSELISRI